MIEEIDVAALEARLSEHVTLIDVRMPDEFASRRVPGATLIPLPELPERYGEIDPTDTVFVICQAGGRSLRACEFLAAKGYNTINIAGGTGAWAESGRPTESGPNSSDK